MTTITAHAWPVSYKFDPERADSEGFRLGVIIVYADPRTLTRHLIMAMRDRTTQENLAKTDADGQSSLESGRQLDIIENGIRQSEQPTVTHMLLDIAEKNPWRPLYLASPNTVPVSLEVLDAFREIATPVPLPGRDFEFRKVAVGAPPRPGGVRSQDVPAEFQPYFS